MTGKSLICVCLKPVWRTEVPLRLEPAGGNIRTDEALRAANPADLSALGLAFALRDAGAPGQVRVAAYTVGPPAWEDLLREARAHGVDEAVRVWGQGWPDGEADGFDGSAETTRRRALALARVLEPRAPVLMLAGERSGDGAHEAFAAFLAQALGAAFAHRVGAVSREGNGWRVVTRLQQGYGQEMVLPAPTVASVSARLPRPGDPSLPRWLASRQEEIPTIEVETGEGETGSAPSGGEVRTALRLPVPRVKPHPLPGRGLPAESRIQALVTLEAEGGGIVLAEADPARQAAAIERLLRERGYL
jgi:electron transfer flavoprotein alpha/beta subunit